MRRPTKVTSGIVEECSQEGEETYGTSSYVLRTVSPLVSGRYLHLFVIGGFDDILLFVDFNWRS